MGLSIQRKLERAWQYRLADRGQRQYSIFRELRDLHNRIATGAIGLGDKPYLGTAPAPQAAILLARAAPLLKSTGTVALDAASVREVLARFPVWVLESPSRASQTFEALGVQNLGDILDLPRAGLKAALPPVGRTG